jgi:hypothetical protein
LIRATIGATKGTAVYGRGIPIPLPRSGHIVTKLGSLGLGLSLSLSPSLGLSLSLSLSSLGLGLSLSLSSLGLSRGWGLSLSLSRGWDLSLSLSWSHHRRQPLVHITQLPLHRGVLFITYSNSLTPF